MNYTLAEDCTLPSKGLIYPCEVNPHIKLRSMTVKEEMKRLSPSDTPNKQLCEVIDDCMVEHCGISSYDMCLGDFQYLLHKLRVVTYGKEYKLVSICSECGNPNEVTLNLDELEIKEYTDKFNELLIFDLPVSKKRVELYYQTPRMLDNIALRKKEIAKKSKNATDQSLLITLSYLIKSIDGTPFNQVTGQQTLENMGMRDVSKILTMAEKINKSIGVNTELEMNECSLCHLPYKYPFRLTSEFFGPREE